MSDGSFFWRTNPAVHGDIKQVTNRENSWLCERAIHTTQNELATDLNDKILSRVAGKATNFNSISRVVEQDEASAYPIKKLNSLLAPGLPSHSKN